MSLGYEFSPIDVNITTHPKAFAAGVEAMGLWLWGMAHARQHRTGGHLHRAAVLGAWGGRRNIILAKKLVEAGLWTTRADGDWDIFNFEAKTSGSRGSAERMRRLREREKAASQASQPVTGDVTVTRHSVTSASMSMSPSLSDLGSRDRVVGPDGDSGVIFGAYVTGVREATGKPMTALQVPDRKALVAMANAHAEGRTGESLETWVRETARDFARQHDSTFGGFSPAMCAKWLDGGRKVRAGPAMRHVQSAENRAWELPPELK